MSVCNCVISVKKCFLSSNNGFLRFCRGKTQVPIKNYILNSTNRITTVLCQKCLAQQAHIIRASTLHPSSTILLLSYIFLCEQKMFSPIMYTKLELEYHYSNIIRSYSSYKNVNIPGLFIIYSRNHYEQIH